MLRHHRRFRRVRVHVPQRPVFNDSLQVGINAQKHNQAFRPSRGLSNRGDIRSGGGFARPARVVLGMLGRFGRLGGNRRAHSNVHGHFNLHRHRKRHLIRIRHDHLNRYFVHDRNRNWDIHGDGHWNRNGLHNQPRHGGHDFLGRKRRTRLRRPARLRI